MEAKNSSLRDYRETLFSELRRNVIMERIDCKRLELQKEYIEGKSSVVAREQVVLIC